jgi:3-phosphoshikimate 1-carboxyvinyltransferase
VKVEGWADAGPHEPADIIDAGNSGTTARILLGLVAGIDGTTTITGDDTLRGRPMLRVVAPLRAMGAAIEGRAHGDRLPLTVRGAPLQGMDHDLSVASAQVKSALLLAGLRARATTSVTEPGRSRDHTERMLAAAGVEVRTAGPTVSVDGGQPVAAVDWDVPGDISSAMFLIVAALLRAGSELTVTNVGLNPTRTGGLEVLRAMGARIATTETSIAAGDPRGDIVVTASDLQATTVGSDLIPTLIDEIPILAIAASQAHGETVFEGVGELRAKESDRLTAIVVGLSALGGHAHAEGDRLIVAGPSRLAGGVVASGGDHRMAMAFAIAGLVSSAPVKVEGWSCVETSFPNFLDVLGAAQGGSR